MTSQIRPSCSIPDCPDTARARTWCWKHWSRWKRYGDPLGTPPPRVPDAPRQRSEAVPSDGYEELIIAMARQAVRDAQRGDKEARWFLEGSCVWERMERGDKPTANWG